VRARAHCACISFRSAGVVCPTHVRYRCTASKTKVTYSDARWHTFTGMCWRASTNELFVSANTPKHGVFALDLDGDPGDHTDPARVRTVAKRT
jgi:hypothetical protein